MLPLFFYNASLYLADGRLVNSINRAEFTSTSCLKGDKMEEFIKACQDIDKKIFNDIKYKLENNIKLTSWECYYINQWDRMLKIKKNIIKKGK